MEIAIIYLDLLARTNKAVVFFAGRLSTIGFDNQMAATVESVTYDVVASSEMEGGTQYGRGAFIRCPQIGGNCVTNCS